MNGEAAKPAADRSDRIESAVLSVLRSTACPELPVVTVSWAQSSAGAIAAAGGGPTALSGPASLSLTHRLRGMHGAILVGIATVLADDPRLSVRLAVGPQPQPVVLDSRLRFPISARLLSRPDRKPWIFHAGTAGAAAEEKLLHAGARLFRVARGAEGLDLREVLRSLRAEGIESVMVEGGARVLRAFISLGLAAQAVITVSPSDIMGVQGPGIPEFVSTVREQYDRDVVTWGILDTPGRASDNHRIP
jgi:GTP cyclohydrolase II